MVKKLIDPPNRIRAVREARVPKVTLRQVAEALGTTQTVISRVETGERPLYMHMARRIAEVLGVSVADLLNEEDNPYRLDDRERDVINAMRHGQAHVADAVHRVAESLNAFDPGAPAPPEPREDEHDTARRA
ncbi:helix-turn-helix domain-containing protein [Sphingomonas alpina]|uniref:Helix-turn-helix transcriptional regulator n=1 Tax=Sphingomonas alpina TaxID=653931 RepID=A0A7H0LHX7_9SPHN|nr:helix-turn-helix transcriptional regulator [Sphingomonas alpina]QNQ09280.1 helix-turn-helix transcriptional regulator [Sphingomonas alpina]